MKKILSLLLVALLVIGLVGCATEAPSAGGETAPATTGGAQETAGGTEGEEEVLKIGVAAPVSGDGAASGKHLTNGVEMYAKSIDSKVTNKATGKTYKLDFIIEDTENKPEVTANVYRRLIDEHGVIAIIGPDTSKCILAAAPVSQEAGIPTVGTFPTNIKVTEIGDYIFRTCFIDPFMGLVAAKYGYEDMGARKAAILYNNADDFPTGLQAAFKENFEKFGGEVVEIQEYTGSEVKDYSVQLSAIKASDADILYLPNLYVELPLQVQQVRQMGIELPILGGDSFDIAEVVTIAGASIEGVRYVAAFSADNPDATAQDFAKQYSDQYGDLPNSNVVLAYEAAMVVKVAIENAAEVTPKGIRDALAEIKGLDTPSGKFSFDDMRNALKSAIIIEYDAEGTRSFVTAVNPE